jgi:uncharacterized membrane protein YkvA (DUF1232 family)
VSERGDLVPFQRTVSPIPVDDRAAIDRMTMPELFVEGLMMVPHLVKLLYRLLRDPRVPRRRKVLIGVAGLYLASPIDLVPDLLLPVVGQVDDLLLAVFSIHHLVAGAPPEAVEEYWDGDGGALELVRAFVEWVAEFVPSSVARWLDA